MDGIVELVEERAWYEAGAELRRLRTDRGMTLPGLAHQVNYTKGYLSKIETGKKRLTPEMARLLDEALETGGVLAGLLASTEWLIPADDDPDPASSEICPYPGLISFGLPEARWFFGRAQATSDVISQLDARRGEGGLLAVVAPSGAGKSSLLAAGLIPALAGGALLDSRAWPVVLTTPGAHPLSALAAGVAERTGADPADAAAATADPERLAAFLTRAVVGHGGKPGETSISAWGVLIVDQFEEIFTECQQETERHAFITALCTAAQSAAVLVVLGVRADFYGRCLAYPALLSALRSPVALGPMSAGQLREIITGPAETEGLQVELGLVELLLRDLGVTDYPGSNAPGYDPGALPLLAHALRATWQQRNGRTLTVAAYQRTGGIWQGIATTAERAYTQLSPPEQRIAQQLLLRLVQVDTHTEALRHRIPRERLRHALPAPAEATEKILETFARARLLTFDTNSVEITHEALLRAWPRLADWITADRAGLRIHQQLSEAADAWDADDRDPALVYRGSRLAITQGWATGPGRKAQLSALEQDYLQASINQKHHEQHAQRRATRLRVLASVMAIFLVMALLAGSIILHLYREVEKERLRASAAELAVTSNLMAATRPYDAMLLAVAAWKLAQLPEGRSALLSAQSQYLVGQLTGHTEVINIATFSPNGQILATGSDDKTVRLWDVASHHEIATLQSLQSPGPIQDAEFSPDGHTLATTSTSAVQLWNVAAPHRPSSLGYLSGARSTTLNAARFSHDGRILAISSVGDTVGLWDAASQGQIATLPDHTGRITKVVFSPVDRILATGSDDGTVRLWNVTNPKQPTLVGPPLMTGSLTKMVFSLDGRTLATASNDGAVRLWNVANHQPITSLMTDHTVSVNSVAFSPDGHRLATGGNDGTTRLWDVDTHQLLVTLRGHRGNIFSVAFNHDGHTVATAGIDRVVRLWDTGGPIFIPPSTTIGQDVALSPDGRTLATVGVDGTASLWVVATHQPIVPPMTDRTGSVSAVAFSPDGHTLATGSHDGTTRLWDLANPTQLTPLGPPLTGDTSLSPVNALVFSHDGNTLATTSTVDGIARLWNVSNPVHPTPLGLPLGPLLTSQKLPKTINKMVFSPDDQILLTAGDDGKVRRWQKDTGQFIDELSIAPLFPGERFSPVAFSSDGPTLATTNGDDNTTELWHIGNGGTPMATLTSHTGPINAAAFSKNGDFLVTMSADHTVRFWDLEPGHVIDRLCHIIGATSQADWERLIPDLPNPHTCS
ncbi:MAG: helix-turn-helix domain-containing protein [Pseudonocardiaceae bacterium]